ncbi:MAG: serine hydrolase domain-containing protein, partial [Thermoanaerobaculia bacterium]|nr:serine hydrolase domain-containing protein [Thermoanaerobaculia bacterium]
MTLDEEFGGLPALLSDLVAEGEVSAVSARICVGGRTVESGSAGRRLRDPETPAGEETLFDLASLTKTITATLALALHRRGDLSLETRLGALFPEARPDLGDRSLEDLLRHRSGLASWVPLYALGGGPEDAVERVVSGSFPSLEESPYSDLGYILWGIAAERATGASLERLMETVTRPLGMTATEASPGPRPDVAECHLDQGREVELAAKRGIRLESELDRPADGSGIRHGSPQDGNARFLGGLAGHAGLFGTAADLARLAEEWRRPERLLDPSSVRRALEGEGRYALGWWRPSAAPETVGDWGSG